MHKNKEDRKQEFVRKITAWRELYYSNLLSEKESDNIIKKINTKYKEFIKEIK